MLCFLRPFASSRSDTGHYTRRFSPMSFRSPMESPWPSPSPPPNRKRGKNEKPQSPKQSPPRRDPKDWDQLKGLLCSTPGCPFEVSRYATMGSYCCKRCHSGYKGHGYWCAQIFLGPTSQRAYAEVPDDPMHISKAEVKRQKQDQPEDEKPKVIRPAYIKQPAAQEAASRAESSQRLSAAQKAARVSSGAGRLLRQLRGMQPPKEEKCPHFKWSRSNSAPP